MCGSERTYLEFVAELRANGVAENSGDPTPPGVLYRCENKRVAEKGFCKTMKTKARCAEGGADCRGVEPAHSLEKRVRAWADCEGCVKVMAKDTRWLINYN